MLKDKQSPLTRIGIFYDGNYFWHVSTFYYQHHERKSRLSVRGLHRFIREQVAHEEGTTEQRCKIVDAHYFRGRLSASEAAKASGDVLYYERLFDDVLNSEGILMHHLPLSRNAKGKKKEKGVDVLFALETYERALKDELDVVVLVAADGDYIPLVRKLHTLGIRVMVIGWELEHLGEGKKDATTYTSSDLLDEATYPILMNNIIDRRGHHNDIRVNDLFVSKGAPEDRPQRESRSKSSYHAPQARQVTESESKELEAQAEQQEDESLSQPQLEGEATEQTELLVAVEQQGEESQQLDTELQPTDTEAAEAPLTGEQLEQQEAAEPAEEPFEPKEPELPLSSSVQEEAKGLLPTELKVLGKIELPEEKAGAQEPAAEPLPGYAEGTIQALKKGFGFIDVGVGENAFFHYKSLVPGLRFDQLIEGDRVEAELHRSEEGKLVASNVALILD